MKVNPRVHFRRMLIVAVLAGGALSATAQDDVADVPSRECTAGGDERKRFFLIGPPAGAEAPAGGYGLLVVLPGSDGGADFHPFVKRIHKNALPEGFLLAQAVAVKWTPKQQIVWPTVKTKVSGQKFTTEQFVDAVIEEVGRAHKLNSRRVFVLGWSSGGPAAYAVALREKTPVAGAYVAMSVFKPALLPLLAAAKGRTFVIDHSPQDKVCPFRMAEQARTALEKAGARVKFIEYAGGHGWQGDVFGRIREGILFLDRPIAKE